MGYNINMTKKHKIISVMVVLCISLIAYVVYLNFKPQTNETFETVSDNIVYTNTSPDVISVELPFPSAVVGKNFSVIGKVRGIWFFEATFPVEVFDRDGLTLSRGIAHAQGEWMTEDFVPFKADIKIPESYIGPATLILKKDNPSGLPEKDASISFPIIIEY